MEIKFTLLRYINGDQKDTKQFLRLEIPVGTIYYTICYGEWKADQRECVFTLRFRYMCLSQIVLYGTEYALPTLI